MRTFPLKASFSRRQQVLPERARLGQVRPALPALPERARLALRPWALRPWVLQPWALQPLHRGPFRRPIAHSRLHELLPWEWRKPSLACAALPMTG
ncbi:hypothetical protein BQ8482_380160 [Mesorhizobium delmotii]|uniref:Uncharacterized protein n=1 Tax=Mesorhizobium delmotii TaxID=1631247 RepID=A0A2P9ASA7_9HYPH|nr:hypothetical protein BQ8482_380160 [Mesorhizobium delmotii]